MDLFKGKHFLSVGQFDLESLDKLFEIADKLFSVAQRKQSIKVLEGCVLGSLFFEASTRTRLSFDSAFMRLGGSVSSTTGFTFSSISKGESIYDTSRVISGYADVVVMRHPDEHAIHEFARATHIPVINGGNGAGEHPTQALLDVYTIHKEFARIGKKVDQSSIALVGDLKYGRTVHSLVKILALHEKMTFVMASPEHFEIPENLVTSLEDKGHEVIQTHDLNEGLKDVDIIYATRVQKERLRDNESTAKYTAEFQINRSLVLNTCKRDVVIMHPLPRDSTLGANDLNFDLISLPNLAIFRQADNGIPVRMALFCLIMGVENLIDSSIKPVKWWSPKLIGTDDLI